MELKPLFKDIADAIREKGGATGPIVAENFPARIRALPGGAVYGAPLDPVELYNETRPSDWLPMPEPQDDEMYLLFHIPDGVSSLLAFTATCTGSYTVALGTVADGEFVQQNAALVASGEKYEAELFASGYGDLTSDGMKQVMIKVSGTDILTWEPSVHSKKLTPENFASWNIVEIKCRLPKSTRVSAGAPIETMALRKLVYYAQHGADQIVSASGMFRFCCALTAVTALDTAKVTDMTAMFDGCYALLAIPALNTSAALNMYAMFRECYSLRVIPALDTKNVITMNSMFAYCFALTTIPLFDTARVTDMSFMFNSCNSLVELPPVNTSQVVYMRGMFSYCRSLLSIPQLDTAKVTDMNSMFYYCHALYDIPELDTRHVTDMRYMFTYCSPLVQIPELDISMVTNLDAAFSYCFTLGRVTFTAEADEAAGCDISLLNCSLSHKAIVELLNSLPAVTSSKVLTLTGNPGVSELTDEEKAIAAGKNWTVA